MRCLTGEPGGRGTQQLKALPPSTPAPAPRQPALAPLRPVTSFFCKWRVDQENMDGDEGEGEGAGTRPRPPRPPLLGTSGGTMASSWFVGGTARSPRCSPPPTSSRDGPAPSVPWPPSWGCSPGSCASRTSWQGPGTGGGIAGTGLWTNGSGSPPSSAPAARSSGPRGPLWAKPCSGGTPRSSTRAPPGWTPAAAASPTHGAATWRPCGRRRRPWGCGGRPGTAGCRAGTTSPRAGSTARTAASPSLRGRRPPAGHTVGVDWWGTVWDNDPTRQPPPQPWA